MPGALDRSLGAAALAALLAIGGGCSSGSRDEFCRQAKQLAGDNPAAVFSSWSPDDPAASRTELERAARRLRELADAAPAEVEDDAEVVADTAEDLVRVLTDTPRDELEAALEDREDQFAEVDEASGRVTEFARTQCGVELEPPPTTAPATTTTSEP
ncbi:MAG: hypothetical protein ACRD29_06120 [Acidimicrobiales bacterium]